MQKWIQPDIVGLVVGVLPKVKISDPEKPKRMVIIMDPQDQTHC